MKIGAIEVEETGLTSGHPPVIIAGKMAENTVCAMNGLLSLNKTTGEFEAYNFATPSGAACVALQPITAATGAAKVLLHGTFNGDMALKANGSALAAAEFAAVQANSQIYFV